MIVCLGWGSLCWNPDSLPINGKWQQDGPTLPLEFARVSEDGRVTLVITDAGISSPVCWVPLAVDTLEEAIAALAKREHVPTSKPIGRVPSDNPGYPFAKLISEWSAQKEISGVVWTALKPGLTKDDRGRTPTLDELHRHVSQLSAEARATTLEYIQRAPPQIRTNYREPLQEYLRGL